MNFILGDEVEWTSKSGGVSKYKRGAIVKIIRPPNGLKYGEFKNCGVPGMRRDHESYVVKVGIKHYWPRVSGLRKYQPNNPSDQRAGLPGSSEKS